MTSGVNVVFVLPPGRCPAARRMFSVPGIGDMPFGEPRHAVVQVKNDGYVEVTDATDAQTRNEFRQWDLSGVRVRIGE